MGALQLVTAFLRELLQSRAAVGKENPAIRLQVGVLHRPVERPKLHRRDLCSYDTGHVA